MSIRLKFVKGAHLSTYNAQNKPSNPAIVDRHIVKVHQLLRIASANRPPSTAPTFDLRMGDLSSVRRVVITAPPVSGAPARCTNDRTTLDSLPFDLLLNPPASPVTVEVTGGTFFYRHSIVQLPNIPSRTKPVGWLQVDFPNGPVTVELFSAFGPSLGLYTVSDGQAFDIASFVMYQLEACALDEELAAAAAGGSAFRVLEGGDGQSGNGSIG